METLILSCSTGGGHNAAGKAVKEELERRGHGAVMLDPYSLAGNHWDKRVGNAYIRLVQENPQLFGRIYQLGDWYRQLPIHSPVYEANRIMCRLMQDYLEAHPCDVILMPHIYPGEILTNMKNKGLPVPGTIYISTDYTCIPFTEEISCDFFVTPSPELNPEFIGRGIPAEKLVPAGIPVGRDFLQECTRQEALARLNLDPAKQYLLLMGGSIGAGEILSAIQVLSSFLDSRPSCHLIVVCGSNEKLFTELSRQYGRCDRITLLSSTDQIHLYLRACCVCISKPGGLSSTEAAVTGTPLIHISPIPGCEMRNMEYFRSHGMSLAVGNKLEALPQALEHIQEEACAAQMKDSQKRFVSRSAASAICDLAEELGCGRI